MDYKIIFFFSLLLGLTGVARAATTDSLNLQPSQLYPATLAVIFSGIETLRYTVSWSGGVKIGEIVMTITRGKEDDDGFDIRTKVKSYGTLSMVYPVDDSFACTVAGPMKLPVRYEVQQNEGHSRRKTHRLIIYDQAKREVRYRKNNEPEQQFEIVGSVYNEFAAFIITRALQLRVGEGIMVPTFAEQKRQDVKVFLLRREQRRTIFGLKETLVVQPKMEFKGLYEKNGDTIVWLSDDHCRVPVEIRSKIVIGSLVAELAEYSNPACPELQQVRKFSPPTLQP